MNPSDECRLLIEPEPCSGRWNMAVDELLLESALEQGRCTLRWYRWTEPTLSLGYFQPADDAADDPRWSLLPRVRRLSGGGAILHDQELTYSVAVPAEHPLAAVPGRLYDLIHARLIARLEQYGIPASLRGVPLDCEPEPFLCFGRGDARDIVLSGHKIVGSAQRRRRGAVLQHGSLLLRRSVHAPEFPGVEDLAPAVRWPQRLEDELCAAVVSAISSQAVPGALTDAEQARAQDLASERYGTLDWSRIRAQS